MTESEIQIAVADYLRIQYPDVIFHSDYGSGLKLTPGQAMRQKRQNGGRRSWPDMFIAEPKNTKAKCKVLANNTTDIKYAYFVEQKYGLFLELKREGTTIYKKSDGQLVKDKHIREQAGMLDKLRKRGYMAEFACGFEEAKRIIDAYLGGRKDEEQVF